MSPSSGVILKMKNKLCLNCSNALHCCTNADLLFNPCLLSSDMVRDEVSCAQVHSITARSVSRQFRESLKAGKGELVDTIFRLPEAKAQTPAGAVCSAVAGADTDKVGRSHN